MNKITRKEAITLIKEFVKEVLSREEWYKNIESEIKAIVWYGSVAKGLNRADSDIDFYIILPLEFEEKFTVGEYFYHFEGREINIALRSIERMRKLARAQNDAFEAEVLRGCEIIWQKDGEVRELIDKIKRVNSCRV